MICNITVAILKLQTKQSVEWQAEEDLSQLAGA